MIIGIFSNVDDAEVALNNLAEADFQPENISVVMRTKEEAQTIADVSGPLTGVPVDELAHRLVKLGLSKEDAKKYEDMIKEGGVLITISTANKKEEKAAREMLEDYEAEIRVLKSKKP